MTFRTKISDLIVTSKKSRIQQVFCNIAVNALKHAKEGKVDLNFEAYNQEMIITIKDNGPGMSDAVVSNLFQLFQPESMVRNSVGNNRSGFGLGLSISKKLIESLNGKLEIESKFGKGTTMIITLPVDSNLSLKINPSSK